MKDYKVGLYPDDRLEDGLNGMAKQGYEIKATFRNPKTDRFGIETTTVIFERDEALPTLTEIQVGPITFTGDPQTWGQSVCPVRDNGEPDLWTYPDTDKSFDTMGRVT